MDTFDSFWEMDSDKKLTENLTDPDADAGVTTIARLFSSKSRANYPNVLIVDKNYKKADDPVICISIVICPCFDIVHRN
jgi:hypothetical protein